MKRIDEVKEPVVGRYYLVPRVWVAQRGEWWPVIGPWHEDADLGVDEEHFHYDVRFLKERQLSMPAERTLGRVHTNRTTTGRWATDEGYDLSVSLRVVYKRMRMNRVMPEFPFDEKFARNVEAQFMATRLVCKVCPHRGMSLEGLPVDDEGRVVCNGHGLRWNLKTGRLSPRAAHAAGAPGDGNTLKGGHHAERGLAGGVR